MTSVLDIIAFLGTCICSEHFYGEDCGLDIRQPPVVSGIPDLGICDLNKRLCATTSILGYGFVETSTLSCKMTPFKVFFISFYIHLSVKPFLICTQNFQI